MSDDFQVGDLAVRFREGEAEPGVVIPPMNVPLMVTGTQERPCLWHGSHQLLSLAGYPLPPHEGWDARFFRKVPPADLKDEPRRVAKPTELEPA